MRRSLAIAALGAALLVPPIWGQMRGASRGAAPVARPGFASRGPVTASRGPVMVNRGPAFVGSPRTSVRLSTGFRQPFFFPHRFHHHRRFFFATTPWWYYGYYGYPGYYGDYGYTSTMGSYAAYDQSSSYYAQNSAMQQEEINRLEDEVKRLRDERESRQAAPPAPQAEKKSEPSAPTVLVFRDKHIQEVHNFAIVGQTLWIFNEQRSTKVPLSSLDVDATTKLNDERGVDFRLPK